MRAESRGVWLSPACNKCRSSPCPRLLGKEVDPLPQYAKPIAMLPQQLKEASAPSMTWRSSTSFSGLTLIITLALIKHFSKPEGATPSNGGGGGGGKRGGRARSTARPKVDVVSHRHCRAIEHAARAQRNTFGKWITAYVLCSTFITVMRKVTGSPWTNLLTSVTLHGKRKQALAVERVSKYAPFLRC